MELIKTSALNFIAVVIKLLTLLGINKILAIYVGPSGYASFGQFQNLIQMLNMIGSGGINNGIVKYTAEYQDQPTKQFQVWNSAIVLSLSFTICISIIIFIFNHQFAEYFLSDSSLGFIFTILSISIIFMILNNALISILNGRREIKKYIFANISGSVLSIIFVLLLTTTYQVIGALISLAIYQSVAFIITSILIVKSNWFSSEIFSAGIDKNKIKNLLNFSLMTLTTAICSPLTLIAIRYVISDNLDWTNAGYWEAAYRLSSAYTMVFSMTLVVYFLPKFSALTSPEDIRDEIKKGYIILTPLLALSAILLFLLKEFVITILFSKEFIPVADILFYQIIGDLIKIYAVMLSYLLISKVLTKEYIFVELLFSILFFISSYILIKRMGLDGITLAYAISYSIYLFSIFFILKYRKII
ncbi:O-antigen translocase [Enterobacteriaceae bacterium TYF_5]